MSSADGDGSSSSYHLEGGEDFDPSELPANIPPEIAPEVSYVLLHGPFLF